VSHRLDPESASYYAIVAICLILIGALITPGALDTASRGSVLAAVVGTLFLVAYRFRRRHPRDDD
jgi:hypothetical protein